MMVKVMCYLLSFLQSIMVSLFCSNMGLRELGSASTEQSSNDGQGDVLFAELFTIYHDIALLLQHGPSGAWFCLHEAKSR
ncbi:hypothetical protein MtrunA17_Chr7g0259061 [Medicago truncatula]|nr:hypothetical protein MtrunA17_Chr7g0259061 [Medicago truncatula]